MLLGMGVVPYRKFNKNWNFDGRIWNPPLQNSVLRDKYAELILILILDQPIDKLSAIISSFCVKLPCQATACLRSLSLTELILSVNFVYRTIEN